MVKISPSILSADFAILGKEVEDIKNAGAEMFYWQQDENGSWKQKA